MRAPPSACTYAATACNCFLLSVAPPMGGITPVCCFGAGTPLAIVASIPARLPSLQSH